MKNKKVYSILIIATLLFSLAITAVPTMAGDYNSVYGFLYINNKIAESGIEVKLTLEEGDPIPDYTDSNGYYQIDFDGHNWEEGNFKVKYKGKTYTPKGDPTVLIEEEIIGYEIDLYIEVEEGGNGGNGGNGGGGNGGGGNGGASSPPPNAKPVADASAGEPYQGFVGEEITFDGTDSSDSDGTIFSYAWDFGDNTTGSGAKPTHIYDSPGEYTVTLTVTDDDGATDTNTTTVIITVPNIPPSKPDIDGPQEGEANSSIEFTVMSTDYDNDSLSYIFDWGDGETTETSYGPGGVNVTRSHTWNASGTYTITVSASDGESLSEIAEYTITIEKESEPVPEEDWTWLILLIIIIIILLILIYLIMKRKKPEQKQPPKKPETTPKKPATKKGKK